MIKIKSIAHSAISDCSATRFLDEASIDFLSSISMVKEFSKGDLIYRSGFNSYFFSILYKGSVDVFINNKKYEEYLGCIVPPYWFGHTSFFEGAERVFSLYSGDEGCVIVEIPGDVFLRYVTSEPEFAVEFIKEVSNRISFLERRISILRKNGNLAKVLWYILSKVNVSDTRMVGNDFMRIKVSKKEISLGVGLSISTVNNIFKDMERLKIITRPVGSVFYIDTNLFFSIFESK